MTSATAPATGRLTHPRVTLRCRRQEVRRHPGLGEALGAQDKVGGRGSLDKVEDQDQEDNQGSQDNQVNQGKDNRENQGKAGNLEAQVEAQVSQDNRGREDNREDQGKAVNLEAQGEGQVSQDKVDNREVQGSRVSCRAPKRDSFATPTTATASTAASTPAVDT